jgi:C-terminal processing protease CtpA/Prc
MAAALVALVLPACGGASSPATQTTVPVSPNPSAPVTPTSSGPSHDPDHLRGTLPDADQRRAVLSKVRTDLDSVYAHRLDKERRYQIDESAAFADAERALLAATTWAAYDEAIYRLLARFHDGHLTYHPPITARPSAGWTGYSLGLDTVLAGDRLLVARVEPASTLASAGVAPGDEVVRIDGTPVADLLAREVSRRAWSRRESATTAWARTWTRVLYAKGEAPRTHQIAVAHRGDGAVVDVAVTPVEVPHEHHDAIEATTSGDLVTLQVRSLEAGRGTATEYDNALASARSAGRLVIDLRGVRGGVDRIGYRLVGGLAEGTPVMGTARILLSDATRAARAAWRDLPADADGFSRPYTVKTDGQPAGHGFHGKLAVVVDAACGSTCEVVAAALRSNLHAVIVGETTAGNTGAPIELDLPNGGNIAIPTWKLSSADGHEIEDDGVIPDVVVVPSADALAAGHDAPFDAAVQRITTPSP